MIVRSDSRTRLSSRTTCLARTPRPPSRGRHTPQSYPLVCRGVPGGSWRTFTARRRRREGRRGLRRRRRRARSPRSRRGAERVERRNASSAPSTPRRYARRLQHVAAADATHVGVVVDLRRNAREGVSVCGGSADRVVGHRLLRSSRARCRPGRCYAVAAVGGEGRTWKRTVVASWARRGAGRRRRRRGACSRRGT